LQKEPGCRHRRHSDRERGRNLDQVTKQAKKEKHNRLLVQNTLSLSCLRDRVTGRIAQRGGHHSQPVCAQCAVGPSSSEPGIASSHLLPHTAVQTCRRRGEHREEENHGREFSVKRDVSLHASVALRSKAALHPCPIGLGSTLQILHSSVRHGQPATPTRPLLRCIHSTPRLFSSLLAGCTTARRERLRSFAQRLFRHSLNSGNESIPFVRQ
jgi:hypothetical protein